MTSTKNNANSRKALIYLIIGLIYPILNIIFVLIGLYLKHRPDCTNVEFMLCTGAFTGFLAGIYNNLIFVVIFAAILLLPITIIFLILAGIFYYKSKK
jgi:hypothetical protein